MSIVIANSYIECQGLAQTDGSPEEWEYLERHTIDSATSRYAMSMADYSSTYQDIKFQFVDIQVTTDGAELKLQFSTDDQSTWNTTQSSYHERSANYTINTTGESDVYYSTQSGIFGGFNIGNGADEGFHGTTTIFNPFDGSVYSNATTEALVRQQFGATGHALFFNMMYPSAVITDFGLTTAVGTGGNIDAGEIFVYGRKLGP